MVSHFCCYRDYIFISTTIMNKEEYKKAFEAGRKYWSSVVTDEPLMSKPVNFEEWYDKEVEQQPIKSETVPDWWYQYKKYNPEDKDEYDKSKHCCATFWKDFCDCI